MSAAVCADRPGDGWQSWCLTVLLRKVFNPAACVIAQRACQPTTSCSYRATFTSQQHPCKCYCPPPNPQRQSRSPATNVSPLNFEQHCMVQLNRTGWRSWQTNQPGRQKTPSSSPTAAQQALHAHTVTLHLHHPNQTDTHHRQQSQPKHTTGLTLFRTHTFQN